MNNLSDISNKSRQFNAKYIIISIITLLIFFIISVVSETNTLFFLVMFLFVMLMVFNIKNYKKNIVIIMFLICYFMFLLGSYFLYEFFGYSNGVVLFDTTTLNHIYLSLLISLIGISIGYYTSSVNINGIRVKSKIYNDELFRKASLILYYTSYIPYIIIEILRVIKVREVGYTELYIDEAVRIPYLITLFAYGCRIYFFVYLSTLPKKKEANFPILLFLIYSFITLMTGNRSIFVVNVSLIFIYFILRSSDNSGKNEWISKRKIITLMIIVPFFIIGLDIVGSIRFNNTIFETNRSSSFIDIFVKQGVSSSVIGYGKLYEHKIPRKIYSFGSTIEALKYNPISNILFNFNSFGGNSIQKAINGNSFAHIISYLVLPYGYVRGRGLGTCYIAEAYNDFGYFGVLIFSYVYGIVIKKCSSFTSKTILGRSITLMLIGSLLMIPRSNADSIISIFIKSELLVAIVLLKVLTIIYYKTTKTQRSIIK